LQLAELLRLGPDEARAARHAARAVAGRRTALVVREAGMSGPASETIDTTVRLLFADGTAAVLDEHEAPPPPGSVTALRGQAGTTPRAGRTPFVIDIGGGTVDLHREDKAVVTAGAGELVTRICQGLLGVGRDTAERAKRHRAARVETPFVLHHEDGSRTFLGEP